MAIERVSTGILGFDEICEGGLIRNRSYLVSGVSGSGNLVTNLLYP